MSRQKAGQLADVVLSTLRGWCLCHLGAGTIAFAAVACPISAQGVLRVVERRPVSSAALSLGAVGFAKVLGDGRVLLSQPQDATVWVLSPTGNRTAILGRRGEGPGEFKSPVSAGTLGDTLWVFDSQLHRFSFFSASGRPVRDLKVPMLVGPAQSAAMDKDGSILLWTAYRSAGPRAARGLVRLAGTFASPTPLLTIPDDGCEARSAPGRTFSLPYCSRPYWGQSADGRLAILLDPVSSRYQETGLVKFVAVALSGDTVQNVQISLPRTPLPALDFESTLATIARHQGLSLESAKRLAPRPHFRPPGNWIVVDPSGGLWIGQARVGDQVRWTSVAADGTIVGYLDRSVAMRVLASLGITLLVLESTDDGEEHLEWWRTGR